MAIKLSTSRKISLALLGLALFALAVDRLFLAPSETGPQEAQARVSQPLPIPAGGPVAARTPAPAKIASLAERLKACAGTADLDPNAVREAFVPAAVWLASPKAARTEPLQPTSAQEFVQEHQLTSVIFSERGGTVLVNNKIIQVGQEIDGYKLIAIGKRSARFQAGEECVELKMQGADGPAE